MFNLDNFNVGNMFNGMFGKVDAGLCAMSMSGKIAIKTSNGTFKSYDVEKRRLTNVSNLCFDASDFFFVMPTSKVQVGDVILVKGADNKPHPKCVIRFNDEDKSIKCMDFETNEIREIVPERHVFMGSTYFYGKIVSLFGNAGLKGKGLMGKLLQLMVMKSFMGGGNKATPGSNANNNGGDMFGGLGQLMMMQSMFGGMFGGNGGNGMDGLNFANMFNLDFDTDGDEEDGEVVDETAATGKPAKKKRTKKVAAAEATEGDEE